MNTAKGTCSAPGHPDMNFYLEMLNKNINTGMLMGMLVSEIMKSNRDPVPNVGPEYSKNFIKFLIHKIIDDK